MIPFYVADVTYAFGGPIPDHAALSNK
ncbi:hypothetical protein A2U01_0107317, partial [Trifolium medium]|nr:hypothetical protein [Trifolium medium]